MTITKYLDVMHAMGLLRKKKIGNVNIWFAQIGVTDIEFPINYIQIQQKLISSILAGDEDHGRRILLSIMNSSVDHVKVLTDVVLPAVNTIGELYSRGKLNKTERVYLVNLMMELDRKSTHLNSSHANISYAVFCLKKKNTKSTRPDQAT